MSDPILARSTRGQTLRNKFESQTSRLSYTDYHYEDVKARLGNAISPSDQTRKLGNKDEIVRHMSNLPSFLETRKDRVLNFGVMDWGKLQKWQYQQQRLDSCSPCSSNSSPLVSTGWSTPQSTKSQRCYPAGQSPYRLTLQSHFNKLQESESTRDCTSNSASLKGKMKIQDAFGRTRDFSRIGRRTSDGNSETDEGNRLYQGCNTFKEKRSSFSSKTFDHSTRSKSPIRRFSFSNTKRTESPVTHVSSRAHSSPLRRLFEPLLKATHSRHTTENPCQDSKINTNSDSASGHDKGEPTSTRRALFGSAAKNGLPLFTFATEDNSNILAANVQEVTSCAKDNSCRWIYTIYTVDEIKKKNASWLSSTRKDKGHASHASNAYASNVTAQMSVTNRSVYSSNTREFSLFRMDPYDELAAIVVKFPRNTEAEEPFSTTVILPGGDHGGSSDSNPSSLTDRWRSGGVCDCGGWDLGCRLTTLTTQVQSNGWSNSPNGQLQLFFQGDVMTKKCCFNFCPMKQGMFSVEYDSSMSSLQAFSICISVVECRKSSGHQESATGVATQVKNGPKPGRFASFPPLSPVGRV